MRMYFLKRNNEEFALQLGNFANKIPIYKPTFNLTEEDVEGVQKDSDYFSWSVNMTMQVADTKKGWTSYRNIIRFGQPYLVENMAPVPVEILPVPDVVLPGIQVRFINLVNRIKAHPNYTEAIGQILGIESSSQNRELQSDVKPFINLKTSGGHVVLQWKKGEFDGIVIEKDSGNGFAFFDKDTSPNFIDPTPLPVGQSAIWKYQVMYFIKDVKIGDWSDVATITVGR
jgi:hypothetical protein